MDICHLKNAELEPKFLKHKGRVVLRGDNVKDDSGACAVFAEQGSSAPQMTAAKVMDVIARQPDCDGQAADAVSAYAQVKMEDASQNCSKFPNQKVQTLGYVNRSTKWPKSWASIVYPVVPLERNLFGHPLAGLLWERQFEEVLLELGWEKVPKLGMSLRLSKTRIVLIGRRG